jgi:hypothetical protein
MLRFSGHARNRMRPWRVTGEEVEQVLADPDTRTPSVRGRSNAWKLLGGRWLRVIHVADGPDVIVVTVTAMQRGPRKDEGAD